MTRQTVSRWALLIGALVLMVALAGCGGSDPAPEMPPDPPAPTPPTPYETATDAIAAATTAAAAQAAYDAVKDDVTAAEGARLQMKVDARIEMLNMMARAADQKTALMTAAGMIDTSAMMTAEEIAAANMAIATLKTAIANAMDVSAADRAMYQTMVDTAEANVMTSQSALDHADQTMKLANAVTALQAIDLADLDTQAKIDAAEEAIAALQTALTAATELSDTEKSAAMTELATARRNVMAAQGRTDRAGQMMVLSDAVDALGMIDLDNLMTQAQIDAAEEAIVALDLALEAAADLTDAEKLNATVDVTVAKRRVTTAKEMLADNIETQTMALKAAYDTLVALGDLSADDALDTAEKITAAKAAVDALKMALDEATHLSDADKAKYQMRHMADYETVKKAQTGMDLDGRMATQRKALMDTAMAARTAVGMVDDDATDAEVTAADDAIAALKKAIADAEDLPEGSTDNAQGTLDTLEGLLASAKTSRTTAMAAADKTRNEANAATAAKLYAGIGAPMGEVGTYDTTDLIAGYDGDDIVVQIGTTPVATAATATLTEDKKTTVADLHGWEGKRYTHSVTTGDDKGDMYEAVVYSDVGAPTMGAKFNSGDGTGDVVGFALDSGSTDTVTMTDALNIGSRIASPRFTHTAGNYTPTLPDPNPRTEATIPIPGTYYGVAGTYTCTPATGSCTVAKATEGYTFAVPAAWTFKATNPAARVTEMEDDAYASYGWWLYTKADGSLTASAFVDDKGTAPTTNVTGLVAGSATYSGGAAGKYALSSSTGGTNDAGHFTARAMLEADFEKDEVTGTIDRFIGADGQSRDWTVELKKSALFNGGDVIGDPTRAAIARTADPVAEDVAQKTVWTIGGRAADASGNWSGALKDTDETKTDTTGLPKIGTGTFYSEYDTSGRMVGGFGVTRQ